MDQQIEECLNTQQSATEQPTTQSEEQATESEQPTTESEEQATESEQPKAESKKSNGNLKFTELKSNDLEGNEVSFKKYENKCVFLVYLSPVVRNPTSQVEELNKIHDKYNGQGKNSIFMKFLNIVLIFLIQLVDSY